MQAEGALCRSLCLLRASGLALLILAQWACGSSPPAPSSALNSDGLDLELGPDPGAAQSPQASPTVEQGEQLLAQGKVEEAEAQFRRALDEDATDARAHFDLALALELRGAPSDAALHYRRAIEHYPSFADAMNNLGRLLVTRGEAGEARALLQRALRLRPQFVDAHVNLALALEDLGQHEQALGAWEQAAELEPSAPIIRVNYGFSLLRAGHKARAATELEATLQHAGKEVAVYQAAGSGLRQAGAFEPSIAALERAIDLREGGATPALLSELALAQRGAGKARVAEQTLERALMLDAKYATAHFLMGSMLLARRALVPARHHLQRYLTLEPDGPHAGRAKEMLAQVRNEAAGR